MLLVAGLLAAPGAVSAAEPAAPSAPAVPNADFEAARPWDLWELIPAEPREAGRSEWERLAVELVAPPSGRVTIELSLEGAGRVEFDGLELLDLSPRGAPGAERRLLRNAGFEESAAAAAAPAGWELSGGAIRVEAPSALEGAACLRLELAKRGRASARQELALEAGRRYLLVARVRGEVTSGSAVVAAFAAGPGAPAEPIAAQRLAGSTLAGGRGFCGRLVAARGAQRVARLDCPAAPGKNYTLELLARGELGERAVLKAEVYTLDDAGTETLLAAATPAAGALGADWRPLRVNFALRGARKVRLVLRLDGPATLEVDSLRLLAPRVVPAPRRLAAGDAEDNFRPKSRGPLLTTNGRRDAELAGAFTALVSQSLGRPQSSWRFWRSSKPFDHQSQPFAAALEKGLEPGGVYLLDPAGAAEAKWLAERGVTVPDRPGAYALAASAKELVVAARSPEGFLAAASAAGWLVSDSPEPEVFACRIEDWPAWAFRAAALDFDGRLAAADRALLAALGSWRLSHLVVTGPGCWRLADTKTRADIRELAEAARTGTGGGLVAGLDALGAAPELVRRWPQAAEAAWQSGESHYLRGTELNFLGARNVVIAAGAPVEVAAPDGKLYQEGRDYRLNTGAPRWGAEGEEAPRSSLQRVGGGGIPDGGRVTVSYNALPGAKEAPAACPRSEEALAAFREALAELGRLTRASGVGLGGSYAARMRTDRRTAPTRFKNGRLLADRVAELAAAADKSAPGAFLLIWADLVNPCGSAKLPEDSPAAAADLIDPALRKKLVMLVDLADVDEQGRENMARSTAFLVERGYRLAGWTGPRAGAAARAWVAAVARQKEPAAPPGPPGTSAPKEPPRGEFAGLALDLRGARALEIEAFAEAAWNGAELKPEAAGPAPPPPPK